MFDGVRIFCRSNWPIERYATRICAVHSHWLVAWFERKLGLSTVVCWVPDGELYREADAIIMGGSIYCGPRMYADLKRGFA